MHGMVVGGGRGCFTPSQWMELEHQALIYKYIMANVPVPANLLIPIRKAFESTGFYYSTKLFRPNYGFHFGFSHRADLEPGRCRRTDGKKWRCSRDAVAEQKYCERHMNRGRHRSRKPVEGLSLNAGHPISGGATAATACVAATTPTANKPSLSIGSMMPNNCTSYNSFSHFQSGVLSLSDPSLNRRLYMNKETLVNDKIQISSPGFFIEYKSKATPYKESPLFKRGQNLGTSKDLTDQEPELNQSVGHYTNDYSSDATDLSISVTMASKDNNTLTLSPLISAYDQNHVHMNLGVGGEVTYNEHAKRQQQAMNWIPISWDSSMGDPLGEVLHNANSTNSSSTSDCKNSSVLNLMTGSWKGSSNSPLESSPT
ncbi:hypothetical protein SAY87_002848 [Trapa incisa]|uniref:Growth-regulating factor n=1 Tax=Trapa incisa TaxID=236973 RepID=A0AAN7KRF4_9MYRT|nr:hypothetical protein SAY87_002848 [Trapa incisa]